ncbi:MAG: hypothetical protein ACYC8T_06960, partial [Myxococcaceae bacterium]
MATTGCLLPQDDQLLSDFPIQKNSPPTIAPVTPLSWTVFIDCGGTAEFTANVFDINASDLIRVRCYLDPNVNPDSPNFRE